ncbi:mediator of RNA polymerase II transcription subunit 12-like isoform X1 [Trichogramma pretiosum]|uniref:mediator of RNA polymerase II transcription subunit 12-like isoform X1 n=1 Tax=Trichogramma pretiosum TaxID=7493 RepID=UPI0006C9CB29|nr:mediator of RNA polymerase II transcription subunit 12-like isoform X1 [Trichogramma pretiosum]XP_023314302.1 mediator of RNA polymerase II transcription subunit 12-like isoform X1 [Trichogramma pretiosum]
MMGMVYEKRPLKRPRLGPPDVYPQEPKQKEDELTPNNVKHGFTTTSQLSDEHGSARNLPVTAAKIGAFFNAIMAKKEELATMPDTGRKRQQINPKDNFWPVTARTKNGIEAWFKDLSGCKPLVSLAKKAPNFNKKEDIFSMLCEYQVPMLRAAWFIKLSSAYTVAVSEAKIKKRQLPDPTTEWTGTLIKFLKDQLTKLHDYYLLNTGSNHGSSAISNGSNAPSLPTSNGTTPTSNGISGCPNLPTNVNSSTSNSSSGSMSEEHQLAFRQWHYCNQLAKYMFEEGLLDRQEFLSWILELLDKLRSAPTDDGILKLLIPLTLQYIEEFVQSELFSRRLAYLCCRKIAHMCVNVDTVNCQTATQSPVLNSNVNVKNENGVKSESQANAATPISSQLQQVFNDYLNCPHHRDVLYGLSAIIQVITIECPTALVWNNVGESKCTSALNGSPLDHLPCPPSVLPIPSSNPADPIRQQLTQAQERIRARSQAAESRWSCDKWQQSSAGMTTTKILATLDSLDRHSFDRMDANHSLDTLYAKIFTTPTNAPPPATSSPPMSLVLPSSSSASANAHSNSIASSNSSNDNGNNSKHEYSPQQDAAIVEILCEWAVSAERWGEHRAMAVAKLLEKRQAEATGENNDNEDKESVCSNGNGASLLPIFQGLLMKFLDNDAPVLDNSSVQSKVQFTNLVHLFAELIRHDVFSHDAYMCTLISRGDLMQGPAASKPNTPSNRDPMDADMNGMFSGIDMKPSKLVEPHGVPHLDQMRGAHEDDSKIDDDLDKLLRDINTVHQNSMDAPDSPKDPDALHTVQDTSTNKSSMSGGSRHLLYTTHFPLPQDDSTSQHDCNQRHVLLYGVGRVRDEARHLVKKMTKEVCKLFGKKFSIDVAEGGKVKKHSRSEFNFEAITQKFQNLSYFDQHVVTWQCATQVVDMLNTFVTGSSYLPVQEHVAFLFDLMELSLSINALIDISIQILKELPDVEAQLDARKSNLVRNYTTNLCLYIVGVFRRYHSCLLLSPEQATTVFSLLCKLVAHVSNPSDCSSSERCILAYLHDLYLHCSLLKSKPHSSEGFNNAYPKIRAVYFTSLVLVPTQQLYTPQFMLDVVNNPRRGGKIELQWAKVLNESLPNRYSFVTNTIISICNETDNDKLNDLCIMCAELTSYCGALANEWLCAIATMCAAHPAHTLSYVDLLQLVDVQDLSMHNSLGVFTCILIARQCFLLEDFIRYIAIPSLVKACNNDARELDIEIQAGVRLAIHLILRLFKTSECPQPSLYSVSTSPHPLPSQGSQRNISIKLSSDRHLLASAHNNISVGPLIAVLKAILVVGDATAVKQLTKKPDAQMNIGKGGPNSVGGGAPGELSISHILGTSDILSGGDDLNLDLGMSSSSNGTGMSNETVKSLSDFALYVLRQICSQEWVLERCLQNPEELCQDDMLLDALLTPRQAQRLLHMICYPDTSADAFLDQKTHITNILENLEQWSLRMSWLDLQLMYRQFPPNSIELSNWLDTVAKAAIDVFQLNSTSISAKAEKRPDSIWLVAPLVSKLPSAVQGRVLKVAGQVLEAGNWAKSTGRERRSKSPSMFNHQPFLSLVLTCLKGQDDQREGLLTSLHLQLSQFCTASKDEKSSSCEEPKARESLQDALQLRFSLVGGVFDTIQRNITVTNDWALLFVQLVSYGVIDLNNNAELFTTVIDMLSNLIHSTLVSDTQCEKDENKKYYQNLMKKLKKELGDKNSQSIQFVRQLLPLPKVTMEVITCEQVGCITDTKGNKIAGFNSIDKKQGLQVYNSQRISAWELLEGHKNPAPLSWAWFRAVRLERKPLTYQNAHKLLRFHTHNQTRSASYYLESPPLPPEDLEPDKKDLEPGKADTPMSIDSPGRIIGGKGKTLKTKRHKKPKLATPANPMQPQQQMQPQPQPNPSQMHPIPYGGQQPQSMPQQPGMFPNQPQPQPQPQPQNPQQWYTNTQQAPHPQGPPQQYPYSPNMGGPRYDRPGAMNQSQSKQALTNMLRLRHPFMNQQQGGPVQAPPNAAPPNVTGPAAFQGMRNQYIRQQHLGRNTHTGPPGMQPQQQAMFAPQQQQQQPQPQQQQNVYQGMQQGMNQNYTGYGGQQMLAQQQQPQQQQQQQQQNMMAQQANMFQNQQQMMNAQTQQQQMMNAQSQQQQLMSSQRGQEYMQQQRMQPGAPRPPYMQQAPNVTMNTMGPMGGGVPNQPAPPYRQAAGQPGVGVGNVGGVGGVGQANVGLQPNQHMQPDPALRIIKDRHYRRLYNNFMPHLSPNKQQMAMNQQQRMRAIMAMQQQQQQQQQQQVQQQQAGNVGQQTTSQLVAHLQRSMNQPPQHPYQQHPPPY